ncbi:hypothetical protein BPY_18780 [Bifidobacterium psychraerophilum]
MLWLVFGPTGAGIAASWIFIQMTPLLVIKFALSILWFIAFSWVWPLQASFENSVGTILKNSFIIGLTKIGYTTAFFVIDVALIILASLTWVYAAGPVPAGRVRGGLVDGSACAHHSAGAQVVYVCRPGVIRNS